MFKQLHISPRSDRCLSSSDSLGCQGRFYPVWLKCLNLRIFILFDCFFSKFIYFPFFALYSCIYWINASVCIFTLSFHVFASFFARGNSTGSKANISSGWNSWPLNQLNYFIPARPPHHIYFKGWRLECASCICVSVLRLTPQTVSFFFFFSF